MPVWMVMPRNLCGKGVSSPEASLVSPRWLGSLRGLPDLHPGQATSVQCGFLAEVVSFLHPGWWGPKNAGGEGRPEPKPTVESLGRTAQQQKSKMGKGRAYFRAGAPNHPAVHAPNTRHNSSCHQPSAFEGLWSASGPSRGLWFF